MKFLAQNLALSALLMSLQFTAITAANAAAAADSEARLEIQTESMSIDIDNAQGGTDQLKIDTYVAQAQTAEELELAEAWMAEEENKSPSKIRIFLEKAKANPLFARLTRAFKKGPAIQRIQITDQLESDLTQKVADSGIYSNEVLSSIDAKKRDSLLQKLEKVAQKKSEKIVFSKKIFGKEVVVTDYDVTLTRYRFAVNGVGYSSSLVNTLGATPGVGVTILSISALSAMVQLFSNPLGDLVVRNKGHYLLFSTLLAPLAYTNTSLPTPKKFKQKVDNLLDGLASTSSYIAKYVEFESGFLTVYFALAHIFGFPPEEALGPYILSRVPLATAGQGLLERFLLKLRGIVTEKYNYLRGRMTFSTGALLVSGVSNSFLALSSVKGYESIGHDALVGLGVLGAGLFAYTARSDIFETLKKSTKAPEAITNYIKNIKKYVQMYERGDTEIESKVLNNCAVLLNKAFPAPPVLPGINAPGR